MTIQELLNKHKIDFELKYKEKNKLVLSIADRSVLVWINSNSTFKMKRKLLDEMNKISEKQVFLLIDNVGKKYYFMQFPKANNWLTACFYNCDKDELFLGKQVLNNQKTLSKIIEELKQI